VWWILAGSLISLALMIFNASPIIVFIVLVVFVVLLPGDLDPAIRLKEYFERKRNERDE
jgi:hypothetical protein